jgi:hypothetical protein
MLIINCLNWIKIEKGNPLTATSDANNKLFGLVKNRNNTFDADKKPFGFVKNTNSKSSSSNV